MICNAFPDTLSRLLLALCPNITSSNINGHIMHNICSFLLPLKKLMITLGFAAGGIQFATAQLPLLELMDCGMTICDLYEQDNAIEEDSSSDLQKPSNNKLHHMYQKLIIKHGRLKRLSLWGCSGLDVRFFKQ